jgi:hypothetical protein
LTISIPNDERPIMTADRITRPDDGVLLVYANPGEVRPRTEIVGYALGLPDETPFIGARAEERRVTTYESLLDWSVRKTYVENAVSGRLGPIGAEWSSSRGVTDLTINVGLVDLQPGQLMAGLTNPTGGPGGVRGGVEFQIPSRSLYTLSRANLDKVGGVREFGRLNKPNSSLIQEAYVAGQWTRRGWLAGYDLMRFQLDNYGIMYEGAPQ